MAGLWQRTGNVTVTNGSKTVTGFGTKWKTGVLPIQKGHAFYGPDGMANEVDAVVSDTEILLVEAYRGGTLANQPYKIDITRTSTISQFAADLASLVGKYRAWFDGMMTWLTGSGDVSILNPDTGANITLPSWKKVASEGEGQATRAKAEADKATVAADLAVNVVRDSAMPLPDVWLPLNDDLRMITGFGGDVKVGELTVAKRANFERITGATYVDKSTGIRVDAAANTPRFESGGLLIEKASTNLASYSHFTGTNWAPSNPDNLDLIKQTDPIMGGDYAQLKAKTSIAASRYLWLQNVPVTAGATYSLTVTVRRPVGSPCDTVRLGCNDLTPVSVVANLAEGQAIDLTLTGVLAAGKSSILAFVWPRVGSDSGPAVPIGTVMLEVGDMQLEPAAVPTSRIRCNGNQTSRAQDKVWLQEIGNMLPLNRDFTISFTADIEYDLADYGTIYSSGDSANYSRWIIWNTGSAHFMVGNTLANSALLSSAQMQQLMPMRTPKRITLIRRGDKSEVWIGGVKVSTSAASLASGFSGTNMRLGSDNSFLRPMPRMHIRDLKIWHFAASDAQAKAIR